MDSMNNHPQHKMIYRYDQDHQRTATGRPTVRSVSKAMSTSSFSIEKKRKLFLIGLGTAVALLLWTASDLQAQARKPPPKAAAAMAEIPAEKEGATEASFMKQTNLRGGLLLSPSIPLGDLGEIVGTSMASFYLFAWMDIPKPWLKTAKLDILYSVGLEVSTGLRFGFTSYSSGEFSDFVDASRANDTASVTTIPILIPLRVGYPLKVSGYGLTPYGVLGFGLTMSSASAESGGQEVQASSSVDGSLLFGVGAEVNVIKTVSAYLELNYLLAVQELSGSFFQIHLGASYSFDP